MPAIRAIETAVPRAVADQRALRDLLLGQPGYGRLGRRLVTAAFDNSGIESRHVAIEEFATGAAGPNPDFFAAGRILDPGTRTRNDAYADAAPALLAAAASRAIDAVPGLTRRDVTHVVTISCTGFFSPGPDFALVRDLGLDPGTQRYHLGFMGCCAAFPGLRIADQLVRADPSAVVLVASVELCSLHVHLDDDPDQIVASSVFADGAASAIVTATPPDDPADAGRAGAAPFLDLEAFQTSIVPGSEAEMAWTIGDHGFDMTLSSYVPKVVGQSIRQTLAPLLDGAEAPEAWAIHPGGRSILDRVQAALALDDEQLALSRDVLRRFGNMSSATVLFELAELLHQAGVGAMGRARERRSVAAVAFGPGLTVEAARLTLVVGRAAPAPSGSDSVAHDVAAAATRP
ncbi:type III polyketide synthase [Frondihabitans australicus]|uniref:Putative naringenin-chalcone synthase n=1 Tax=Frondihabitans australicus TaxID=386892 RepID=A0A495IAQ1_9MICO|nr:type III polyketide synthase [Frondihabitans australicus]RKR73084.1 putative naringenin-chalcone synthase [Frondihabitans australicus]